MLRALRYSSSAPRNALAAAAAGLCVGSAPQRTNALLSFQQSLMHRPTGSRSLRFACDLTCPGRRATISTSVGVGSALLWTRMKAITAPERGFMHRVYHGLRATDGGWQANACTDHHTITRWRFSSRQFVLLVQSSGRSNSGQPRRKGDRRIADPAGSPRQLRLKKARTRGGECSAGNAVTLGQS